MNVNSKYLSINSLHKDKILFYQKLSCKYITAFTKYHKQNKHLTNYKEEVLKWLFSFNVKDRMIICSVENKQYTNIFKKIYTHSQVNSNYKYKVNLDREDYEKMYNKAHGYDSNTSYLNDMVFYQCESSIKDLDLYSNYFTLSPSVLEDEKAFRQLFSKISKDKCFTSPIQTIQDITSRVPNDYSSSKSPTIQLPNWFDSEATLSEYFVALIEQAISVRYIMSTFSNTNDLAEVYCSSYLNNLFERKSQLEEYIKHLEVVNGQSFFDYFDIGRLVKEMFKNPQLTEFILKIPQYTGKAKGWFANPTIFNHIELDKDIEAISKWINDLFENTAKSTLNELMFFHISKLFTYDSFLFRGIIEFIEDKYNAKNCDDLLLDNTPPIKVNNKKAKKKKKKSKEKSIAKQIKLIVIELINTSVTLSCNKKIVVATKYLEDKDKASIDEPKKRKPIFLYDTVKLKQKADKATPKNKQSSNVIISTSSSSEEKNNKQISSITNRIVQNENSISIQPQSKSNDASDINCNKNIIYQNVVNLNYDNVKSNVIFLHHNPLFSITEKLDKDIKSYYSNQEELLSPLLKIKHLIKDYILNLVKSVNPEASVQLFGSCCTGLEIECSDLDISIISSNTKYSLVNYLSALTYTNVFESILPILTATVPVIKLKLNPLRLNNKDITVLYDTLVNLEFYKEFLLNKEDIDLIKIDLSWNSVNNNQINFISNSLTEYPELKSLLKILKRLLQSNNLNNSYHGGLCSYSLFLLAYSYIKWSSISISKPKQSIAVLLIELLMHYGFVTDLTKTLINPTLNNPFVNCVDLEVVPTIIDPITSLNSAKSSFNILSVTDLFNRVYQDLYTLPKNANYIQQLFIKYYMSK